jgi:uncharacterized protein YjbJ (UPF0337 family)
MSLQERAKAVAQDIEGKLEEAIGNITGDTDKQNDGKSKQVEASVRNASEDVKDRARDVADVIKDKAKNVADTVKNKAGEVKNSID